MVSALVGGHKRHGEDIRRKGSGISARYRLRTSSLSEKASELRHISVRGPESTIPAWGLCDSNAEVGDRESGW